MPEKEPSKPLVFLAPPVSKSKEIARNKTDKVKFVDIALIDPRSLIRESFSDLLKTYSLDFNVHTFTNVEQFLKNTMYLEDPPTRSLRKRRITDNVNELNLIVVNIDTQVAGVDDAKKKVLELRKMAPNIPLIVFADQEDTDHIAEAFRNGASGYIPTSLTPPIAIAALRLIIAGGRYIPESIIHEVMDRRIPHMEKHLDKNLKSEDLENLTERQQEVLLLLRQGKSNKYIAYEIGVEESTVKVHVREIMKKLHATNRTHAAYIAEQIESD